MRSGSARTLASDRPAAGVLPAIGAAARALVTGLIIGVTTIVLSISFAAVVYGGDMAVHLSRGIGLTLAGASVMAVVGVFRLSYRGTIVQPQDVTAVILSLAVATIAAGWEGAEESLFATVATLVAVTTAVTGAATWLFGRLGLGFVARFIPYPVLAGFLAATGYLLTVGAIGMVLGTPVSLATAPVVIEDGNLARWLPWMLVGIALAVLSRRVRHGLVLPGSIVLVAAGFYLVLWLSGTSLAAAQQQGLLLGPFEGASFTAGLGPWIPAEADWGLVMLQLPTMAAVAGMAIIGALLYASALEVATGAPIDPNRDLRGVGMANLLAAAGGGMVGYHMLSPTLFARALGVTGPLCGLAVAAISAFTLFLGAGFVSMLPVGVFAGVIAFLGVDLLYTWLWVERRKLAGRDFAIVLLIVAVSATIGFLQAIALGLLAASLQFIIAYSRIDVVRLKTTAASMRSRVERPDPEIARLSRHGDAAEVYRLTGYLFFGTASGLLDQVARDLGRAAGGPRFVVIDFGRVQGVDASAAFALGKLAGLCETSGVELMLSGLAEAPLEALRRSGIESGTQGIRLVEHLDEALQIVEARLLAATADEAGGASAGGFVETLRRLHPDFDPAVAFERRAAAPGEEVIAQGAASDSMVVLLSGRLCAEIVAGGQRLPVATILPGALVGEIGHYAGVARTARVVAEQASELLVIRAETLARLTREAPALAADINRLAAAHLARRLMRTTALLRDADL